MRNILKSMNVNFVIIKEYNPYTYQLIGLVGIVFANYPGDTKVIPKTLKMLLDTSLLNTHQYKVHFNGKVKQSRKRSSALFYTLM